MVTKVEKVDYKNINTNNKQQNYKNIENNNVKNNNQTFKNILYALINNKNGQ